MAPRSRTRASKENASVESGAILPEPRSRAPGVSTHAVSMLTSPRWPNRALTMPRSMASLPNFPWWRSRPTLAMGYGFARIARTRAAPFKSPCGVFAGSRHQGRSAGSTFLRRASAVRTPRVSITASPETSACLMRAKASSIRIAPGTRFARAVNASTGSPAIVPDKRTAASPDVGSPVNEISPTREPCVTGARSRSRITSARSSGFSPVRDETTRACARSQSIADRIRERSSAM